MEFTRTAGDFNLDGIEAAGIHAEAELFVDFAESVLLKAIAHAGASARDGYIAMLNTGYLKTSTPGRLINSVDPKQLPKELAGVEWPPKV